MTTESTLTASTIVSRLSTKYWTMSKSLNIGSGDGIDNKIQAKTDHSQTRYADTVLLVVWRSG